MSIHLYSGVPGTGKSLHAAQDIRLALTRRTPRPVIANFGLSDDAPLSDIQRSYYVFLDNADMSAQWIEDYCTNFWTAGHEFREDYITLCIDECQLLFNARTWSNKDRMSYLSMLSQSRKFGLKVILISQNAKMIDNQFRMLIEIEHNHRRVASMGPVGAAVAAPLGGRLFFVVRYLFQYNERLGMDVFRGSKRDIAMYDSYRRFEFSA